MTTANATETGDLAACDQLLDASQKLMDLILARAQEKTAKGKTIDDHQVLTRKVAILSTRVEAARQTLEYAKKHNEVKGADEYVDITTRLFLCEVARDLANEADQFLDDLGLTQSDLDSTVGSATIKSLVRSGLREANYRALGRMLIDQGAENNRWIWAEGDGSDEEELRKMTRRFARDVVAPRAEHIHRHDEIVPEEFITQMSELGYFGMSIPADYGGVGMTNLSMIIATEELSAASLASAGSLITRPEILAKALLKGGTEEQKSKWLEPVATGQLMVGVAVTEPDLGSDVASLRCRALEGEQNGVKGYFIDGAKAWCTFAGRANILALLARTDANPASGHKGLSLFVVEKESFTGHDFVTTQPGGGKITGKADPTPGYRGMHSFTLQFERYFVPAENLVGGEAGKGKGFYLQMGGFAAGRLQTGGRAIGLTQAALEATITYASNRPQFGKNISEFQNTEFEIGMMAVPLAGARQLTYAAARAMDRHDENATLMAAMAKLFASRAAVGVSQRGQILHGGWGYAEEYPISRYVVDSLVLPIFEGVEPILEMKVIGRGLLAGKE